MAANFNIVPAALLETKNKNIVILAQLPAAMAMLVALIFHMYFGLSREKESTNPRSLKLHIIG